MDLSCFCQHISDSGAVPRQRIFLHHDSDQTRSIRSFLASLRSRKSVLAVSFDREFVPCRQLGTYSPLVDIRLHTETREINTLFQHAWPL